MPGLFIYLLSTYLFNICGVLKTVQWVKALAMKDLHKSDSQTLQWDDRTDPELSSHVHICSSHCCQ